MNKPALIILFLICLPLISKSQSGMEKNILSIVKQYEKYREPALNSRRFKHADILPLLDKLKNQKIFEVQKAGESVEERDIFLIKIGSGDTKILCWSQMHGDEPTATMALFDLFNFFSASDDWDSFARNCFLKSLSILFPC